MKAFPLRSGRRERSGFSLVEVLVALAIFALAGMVLAGAYVNVLTAQQTALRRDDHALALQVVREALSAEPQLENVERWNDLKLPDEGSARWRATIVPTTVADLFEVTLEVELLPDAKSERVTLTQTFRLMRPTWSQPQERENLRAEARSKLEQRTFK